METEEFTLSRVAEVAHAPKRAVQLWADAGVIKAKAATMLAGSGVHRRFDRDELIIACIVSPFARQKMAIGGLLTVSEGVRVYLRTGKQHAHLRLVERAIAGEGHNYLLAYWVQNKNGELVVSDFDLAADTGTSKQDFFEKMKPGGRRVKVDVIALNEVLQDVPSE
jgi:hypothetical protein